MFQGEWLRVCQVCIANLIDTLMTVDYNGYGDCPMSMVGRDMKVILVGDQGQYLLTFENWESCHRQGGNFHEVASISSA